MEEKEFTLQDIIQIVNSYFQEVLKFKYYILLFALLLGFLLAAKNYFTPKKYSENLTFMMDETKAGKGDVRMELLGSLFGGKKETNLGKIIQLFESRKIVHNTLFDSIVVNGKNDFIANHYLDLYEIENLVSQYKAFPVGYKQSWPKKLLDNNNFRFTSNKVDNFSIEENQFLRVLYESINGNTTIGIGKKLSSNLDENTGIMTLNMESHYEDLTLGVLNNIYAHLSEFFIEKSVEKQKKIFDLMTYKKDSIYGALKVAEFSLANFKDSNRKLVTVKGYLKQLQLERELSILNLMYAEVVRQLEATDFTLRSMTPVVQIIDLPRRPIVPKQPSVKTGFVIGFFAGGLLSLFFFLGRKLIKDLIKGASGFKF
jgi:hypothetical protein